jgi:prepilin-type N-terminal cleavage/methylation domain-containing protein
MLNKLRVRAQSESGFTLVELLVVMLILGLLAAIAIPSFFNQRDKARDADAKALTRTAQTAMETYATDNNGSYVGADAADLVAIEPTLSQAGARLTVPAVAANTYTVQVQSEVGATQLFRIERIAGGTVTLTCDVDGTAGCPADGTWD